MFWPKQSKSGYLLGCLALMAAGVLTVADPERIYIAVFVLKIQTGMFLLSLMYTMVVTPKKKKDIP